MSPFFRSSRMATVVAIAGVLFLVSGGIASAHVTIDPDEIARGEANQFAVRIPNESKSASTVKVEFAFPTTVPVTSVRPAQMQGWKAEVLKTKIDPPVKSGRVTIAEAVSTVTWTADPGAGIAPGQFGLFQVLTGPIPKTGDVLVMPTTETYSDGQVVEWNQPATADGAEPAYPAPVVKLTELSTHLHGPTAASPPDHTARWMAGAALLIGALGLGAGGGAILASRRRHRAGSVSPDNPR